jgi:putative aminopeptidase FrvX
VADKVVGGLLPSAVHRRSRPFPCFKSQPADAEETGNDIRTAPIGFGTDAWHAQERPQRDSLQATAELSVAYLLSELPDRRDRHYVARSQVSPS